MWRVVFTKRAQKDAKKLSAAGLRPKAEKVLDIQPENPYQTPPPFEKLIGDLLGACSRRINFQHRLVDEKGNELDMGFSPFRKSTLELYWQFAKMKMGFKLNTEQTENRKLLSDTMKRAEFHSLSYERLHFNGLPKDQARRMYKIIE